MIKADSLPKITQASQRIWAKELAWRIHQAVSIVVGVEPPRGNVKHPSEIENRIVSEKTRANWSKLYDDAKIAMNMGLLPWRAPTLGARYLNRLVTPQDFASFAKFRGLELPAPIAELLVGISPAKDKPRQRSQETEILRVIRELKYDPKALPRMAPGKPWVKSQARTRLKYSSTVFDKAWERLRSQGEIRESA